MPVQAFSAPALLFRQSCRFSKVHIQKFEHREVPKIFNDRVERRQMVQAALFLNCVSNGKINTDLKRQSCTKSSVQVLSAVYVCILDLQIAGPTTQSPEKKVHLQNINCLEEKQKQSEI